MPDETKLQRDAIDTLVRTLQSAPDSETLRGLRVRLTAVGLLEGLAERAMFERLLEALEEMQSAMDELERALVRSGQPPSARLPRFIGARQLIKTARSTADVDTALVRRLELRYAEADRLLEDLSRRLRQMLDEIAAAQAFLHSLPQSPSLSRDAPHMAEGPAAWEMLADAVRSAGGVALYLRDVSDHAGAAPMEGALVHLIEVAGWTPVLDEPVIGSWFRRFRRRFNDADLDTLKRAAEVQALDRFEGESAKAYAEAIAALTAAVANQEHAYLFAKNVLLIKTVNEHGEAVVASRVLTSAEVAKFQSGALQSALADPVKALAFIYRGELDASVSVPESSATPALPPG